MPPLVDYPLVTPAERTVLIRRAKREAARNSKHRPASWALALSVGRLAFQYAKSLPDDVRDDAVQDMLIQAAMRKPATFDGRRGKWNTHCTTGGFRFVRMDYLNAEKPERLSPLDARALPGREAEPGAETPETVAIEAASVVRRFLRRLPQRERDIIRRRNGIGCDAETLEQIGRRLGVTKERVRQLEARAMKQLRQAAGRAS